MLYDKRIYATAESVKELCLLLNRWEGQGVNEVGKNKETGDILVKVNPRFYRPTEVVSVSFRISLALAIFWRKRCIMQNVQHFAFHWLLLKIFTLNLVKLLTVQGSKLPAAVASSKYAT